MIAVAFIVLAATGTLLRWQLGGQRLRGWHVGTLGVNTTAAFVLGLLHHSSSDTVTLIGVGFLGSYSTFSTVVREVSTEAFETGGSLRRGVAYLAATVILGVGAAFIGLQL